MGSGALAARHPFRDSRGRFTEGHSYSLGHRKAGGRPKSYVKALIKEFATEKSLPRLFEVALDKAHKENVKVNLWLAERGLNEELEALFPAPEYPGLNLPPWGGK